MTRTKITIQEAQELRRLAFEEDPEGTEIHEAAIVDFLLSTERREILTVGKWEYLQTETVDWFLEQRRRKILP